MLLCAFLWSEILSCLGKGEKLQYSSSASTWMVPKWSPLWREKRWLRVGFEPESPEQQQPRALTTAQTCHKIAPDACAVTGALDGTCVERVHGEELLYSLKCGFSACRSNSRQKCEEKKSVFKYVHVFLNESNSPNNFITSNRKEYTEET